MAKNAIRKQMIKQLTQFPQKERNRIENKMHSHLIRSDLWKKARVIGTTLSYRFEWDTQPIIEQAWKEHKTICAPKSDWTTKQMLFFELKRDSRLNVGPGNIKEPDERESTIVDKEKIDVLIVPGIAFDEKGYRIGYGGGFFDRYLEEYENIALSLASKRQIFASLSREAHDIPVQYIITEDGWIDADANRLA